MYDDPQQEIAHREHLATEAEYSRQDADRLLKQHDRAKGILGEALMLSPEQVKALRIEELATMAKKVIEDQEGRLNDLVGNTSL